MQTIEFHSHEQQDEFIYNLFDQKKDGFFLDISCGNPFIGSNTCTLEKFSNWTGFCFDIRDVEKDFNWSQTRQAKFVQIDATSEDFTKFLVENMPKDTIVDYISLDIDADSIQALNRVIDAGVKFKAITFEHEFHRLGDTQRSASRKILEGLGMVRLFEDVLCINIHGPAGGALVFEDWWIHPDYFDAELLTLKTSNQTYVDNIEKLKQFKNLDYQAVHLCCAGWPDEYSLFWRPDEETEYKEKFKRYYNTTPTTNATTTIVHEGELTLLSM